MNDSLEKTVRDLIEQKKKQKKEGNYWDFKECWHQNKTELLHDILCLANNSRHSGERYLIFGISDTAGIKGINSDPNRRSQADLLDWLDALNFVGSFRPHIKLDTLSIDNHLIDVLVIADLKHKPYFLSSGYQDDNKKVHAGALYSRVGDKNTAFDRTADINDIEHMWRQRFGLDLSPMKRLELILFDFHNWQYDGISKAYYRPSPKFTLEYSSEEDNVTSPWWSSFLGEDTTCFDISFKHHSTILKTIPCLKFARENLIVPHPEVDYVRINHTKRKDANNTYSLFHFTQESIGFSLLCHLFGLHKTDITKEENQRRLLKKDAIASQVKPPIRSLPFIIFKNLKDKNNFVNYLEKNMGKFFRDKSIKPSTKLGDDKLKEEESFAYWAYDLFFVLDEDKL